MREARAEHWDDGYSSKRTDELSWFQSEPDESLRRITAAASLGSSCVDAGASVLVDQLLDLGFHDLTVVAISSTTPDRCLAGHPWRGISGVLGRHQARKPSLAQAIGRVNRNE